MRRKLIAVFSIFIILMSIAPNLAAAKNYSNLYDIQPGDTLWSIANKYGTTVEDLKLSNGLQSDLLSIGQRLFVPMAYEVAPGDTLWSLAREYNSTVQDIKTKNGLTSDQIYVGQKLKIPPKKLRMEGQYVLMSRDEFKEWLFNHEFQREITLIQQHHTWRPDYERFHQSDHFTLLKGMEYFHVNEVGWDNIAQNITTFPDGSVAVSRPFNSAPDGTIGEKANSIGLNIEHIGDFDKGQDEMTEEHKETIVYITALLCIKFGLKPSIDSITYHRWWDMNTGERVLDKSEGYSVKTCPGTGFFGGNSTDSANNHFYPLVSQKMEEILATMDRS
ncbi:LysM peptidoglycan-binding domain-containing protein [Bacillus shivajii]|uniref:peptidoglycan recognition protein family protein n=1 Tax=Bacillus shivajii TaxID=1983719 RepID=UPI001CFB1347|nr:LysM peptidoglycan-binding domain-containing protein [Bacillus shivajii]UCZ52735.1 LysM peptidoglycan-binding domain-containing protein [Bacillus shivajii]